MASIQGDVFSTSCAFGSCHRGARAAARLDLSEGEACRNLIGVPSCVFPDRLRVMPGSPEQSYLLQKLTGQNLGSNPTGQCALATNGRPQRMPLGADPLCQGKIDQITQWIQQGAACGERPDGGADAVGADADSDTDQYPTAAGWKDQFRVASQSRPLASAPAR